MKLHFKGWNIRSEMLLTILLGNPHIFTQLFTWSFGWCIRIIARRVFKCVTPIYIKSLIRYQILCDYILAPKRCSYTKDYLLEVQAQITFYYCLFPKEHHSSFPSSFLSSVSSRFIYFVIFSPKMTRSVPPNCLLSNPPHSHRFQIWNTAYRSGLCTSSKYISCSQSKRNTYLPALPTILSQKIRTICVGMTKIGNMQISVVKK